MKNNTNKNPNPNPNSFLITKEEFISCIDFIYDQDARQDSFITALENLSGNNEYCNCFLYAAYEAQLIDLLRKLTHDTLDDIRYFLYEFDPACPPRNPDGTPAYTDLSSLYDYLLSQFESSQRESRARSKTKTKTKTKTTKQQQQQQQQEGEQHHDI